MLAKTLAIGTIALALLTVPTAQAVGPDPACLVPHGTPYVDFTDLVQDLAANAVACATGSEPHTQQLDVGGKQFLVTYEPSPRPAGSAELLMVYAVPWVTHPEAPRLNTAGFEPSTAPGDTEQRVVEAKPTHFPRTTLQRLAAQPPSSYPAPPAALLAPGAMPAPASEHAVELAPAGAGLLEPSTMPAPTEQVQAAPALPHALHPVTPLDGLFAPQPAPATEQPGLETGLGYHEDASAEVPGFEVRPQTLYGVHPELPFAVDLPTTWDGASDPLAGPVPLPLACAQVYPYSLLCSLPYGPIRFVFVVLEDGLSA